MRKILYLVQLPPPIHGVSLMNHYVTSSRYINEGFNIKILRLHFSDSIDELRRKHLKKVFLTFLHLFRLAVLLIKFKPDIVYFSIMPVGIGFLRDLMFVFILKISGATLLYHLHNRGIANYAKKAVWRKLYKYAFSNTNIIHVSEDLLKSEIDILGLRNTTTYAVNNTIEEFDVDLDRGNSKPATLLFLSNLFKEKGLMVLLEAVSEVKRILPHFELLVYGASRNSKEDSKYNNYIKQHNLDGNVKLQGPIYSESKIQALGSADIFIFPSYFREECFPLSLLEAMQAGLPIIATKIGAIPEMIEDGKEGILIDPLSVNQLVDNIVKLAQNELLRKQLGENAYNKFKKHYTLNHFEIKLRDIFLDTIHD